LAGCVFFRNGCGYACLRYCGQGTIRRIAEARRASEGLGHGCSGISENGYHRQGQRSSVTPDQEIHDGNGAPVFVNDSSDGEKPSAWRVIAQHGDRQHQRRLV
jgi:hypothetical protein